jgi:flagellar FliL protein
MADHGAPAAAEGETPPKKKGKLLLIAIPVLLIAVGAGGWFSGIIPSLLGSKPKTVKVDSSKPAVAAVAAPVYVDVPEIIANLNVSGKRPSYMKLHAKLEIGAKADEAAVTAAMPRIQDLFQTYLRDMRPEELRGSEGSYRLREELIDRATTAAAPAHVTDVLFVEMIIE